MNEPLPPRPQRLLPFDSDSWRFIIPAGLVFGGLVAAAVLLESRVAGIAACVAGLLFWFIVFFFRDPERPRPEGKHRAVSPADGHVTVVETVDHDKFPGGKAHRIAIFLSVFDVHVNRVPLAGEVESVEWRAGKFLNAMNPRSADENERCDIWMKTEWGPMLVRQIAGLIARRIVCRVKEGDELVRSQRFGLIRFGSGTEIYLPTTAKVLVAPKQFVRCGRTILAEMPESPDGE